MCAICICWLLMLHTHMILRDILQFLVFSFPQHKRSWNVKLLFLCQQKWWPLLSHTQLSYIPQLSFSVYHPALLHKLSTSDGNHINRALKHKQTLNVLGIFAGVLRCVCRTDHGEHQHCHRDRYWVRAGPTAGHYFSILPVQVHKWIHQMKCLPVQGCATVKKRKNDLVLQNILWLKVFLQTGICMTLFKVEW